jgi:hypothetical protein
MVTMLSSLERAASGLVASEATMVLSEARGLRAGGWNMMAKSDPSTPPINAAETEASWRPDASAGE